MKTSINSFMRVVSLCLALCLIVGLIWLPSKQNHTHAETLTGSTTASVPVGDTIVFNEDFADGKTGWEQNGLTWVAPNKVAVLKNETAADDALMTKYTETEIDNLGWNNGYFARGYYWGMEYTFDAKMDGTGMAITIAQTIYGTNSSGGADTHSGRYVNAMIGPDGKIYNDCSDTATVIGQIDTTKYDLTEWHTYRFLMIKTTQYSGNYHLWIQIDGQVVPYVGTNAIKSNNGATKDYFTVYSRGGAGTLEVDNMKVIAANFSGNYASGDAAGSEVDYTKTISYNTTKGQPITLWTDDFESGEIAVSGTNWSLGKTEGGSITVGDKYANNTGYVERQNTGSQSGRYNNSPLFDVMVPLDALPTFSFDAALESNGALQFRWDMLTSREASPGGLWSVCFQYALRTAIGSNKAGLYAHNAAAGAAPLVDLTGVDMTQWHTYTLRMTALNDGTNPTIEFYVDGQLLKTFNKPGDGGYSNNYYSTATSGGSTIYWSTRDQYRERFQFTDNTGAYNMGLTGKAFMDNVVVSYDAFSSGLTTEIADDGKWTASWTASPYEFVDAKVTTEATGLPLDQVATRNFAAYDVYVNGKLVADGISVTTYAHDEAANCSEATVIEVKIHGSLKASAGLTATIQPHIKGSTPVIENETGSTCKDAGTYDEVYYCTVCGAEADRVTRDKALDACTPGTPVLENMVPATCTQEGSCDEVVYCTVCGKEQSRVQKILEVQPHSLVVDEAVAPSCTETGLTEGYHCQYCGKVYVAQEEIPVVDHTAGDVVIENVVRATCAAIGTYDEAIYCTECGKELSRTHKTTEKLPHTPVTDKAVEPSCTETGLTEGSHCDVCGEVFVAQEVVPVVEHTDGEVVVENAVGATCGEPGTYEDVVYCTVCGKELSREKKTTEKLPHTPVTDAAVAAGCETTGLTEGSHCDVCGEILVAQEEVPAAGHTEGIPVQENVSGATCGATGSYEEVVYCSICSKELSRTQKTTEKLPHTPVTDAAVAAGCETTGLTEGSHCDVCGEVLVAQEEVPALGHSYDNEYDTTCNNEGCTTGDREGPAQTGDASIIALAAMMLPASGIGLSALCIKRKKENEEQFRSEF